MNCEHLVKNDLLYLFLSVFSLLSDFPVMSFDWIKFTVKKILDNIKKEYLRASVIRGNNESLKLQFQPMESS